MDWIPSPLLWPNLSLGGISSPLRIKKRTWWMERRILSINFSVLEIVQPLVSLSWWNQVYLKPSFSLILIKRLFHTWDLIRTIIRSNIWNIYVVTYCTRNCCIQVYRLIYYNLKLQMENRSNSTFLINFLEKTKIYTSFL